MREIMESNLIRSCCDNRVGSILGDDKIIERMHARHTAELDLVVLALAEVLNGVVGADRHGTDVLEHELIFAALRTALQLSVAPHVVSDGAARASGTSDQSIVAAFGGAGQRLSVTEESVSYLASSGAVAA